METKEKETIIKKMKQAELPEYMIEAFEEANILPIKTDNMTYTVKSFNKMFKANATLETIGYSKEVQEKLYTFYELLNKN